SGPDSSVAEATGGLDSALDQSTVELAVSGWMPCQRTTGAPQEAEQMGVCEQRLQATAAQQTAACEAIRAVECIRTTCLRLWREEHAGWEPTTCRRPAAAWPTQSPSFTRVSPLTSRARQAASADRAWAASSRFSAHCRSVAYKTSGVQFDPDGRHLTCTAGCGIGRVKPLGSGVLHAFPPHQQREAGAAPAPGRWLLRPGRAADRAPRSPCAPCAP